MARLVRRGEFVGPGEEQTARYLAQHLPDDWVVICNKELPRERSSREVDFLVIGSHSLFVIEEKHWSGTVRGNEDGWILASGESDMSPLRKLEDIAKRLAQKLKRELPDLAREMPLQRSAFGLYVIMSHPAVRWEFTDPRAHGQVVRLSGCDEDLLRFDALREADGSIGPFRTGILHVLEQLPDRPDVPARVGSYAVLERIAQIGPVLSLRARHDDGSERILKLVRRPTTADQHERDEIERSLIREYEALRRLATTGRVPAVDPYFTWDQDQFWVLPLHAVAGRSLRADVVERDGIDGPRARDVATSAFDSLAALHAAGVVHRALTPDRIFIRADGTLALTDLLVARLPGTETVATQVDELDPNNTWRAPECAADPALATTSSDVWGLGACLSFWLSGEEEQAGDVERAASLADYLPQLGAEVAGALAGQLRRSLADDPDRRPSAAEIASALTSVVVSDPDQEELRPGELAIGSTLDDGRYRVERKLGEGATAVTYLATDLLTDVHVALKVIRDPALAQRLVRPEWRLSSLAHPSLPRIFDVYPAEHPFQVKLEYIRGSTLREVRGEFKFEPDACRRLGAQIGDALRYLGDRGLIHRDVSPSNIVIPDEVEGTARLIDFGLATGKEDSETAVGTPRYRAIDIDRNGSWSTACDVYSLAAVLFEAVAGRLPFELDDGIPRKDRLVTPTEEERRQAGGRLLDLLLKAVAPDPPERFESAAAFVAALERSGEVSDETTSGEERVNPTVDALRALYRNSRAGNSDNRGLDTEFARGTYVETHLDEQLAPAILAGRYRLVILSGNPGDGKTAFLQRFLTLLGEQGGSIEQEDPAGWSATISGVRIAALYDASESHGELTADQLVQRALAPLAGDEPTGGDYSAILAVNDGRLLDFFERRGAAEYAWLWSEIRAQLFQSAEPDEVVVVDLKARALAAGEDSLFGRVLAELVSADRWSICEGCVARQECPMRFNALSFGDPQLGPIASGRLADLSRAVHVRREQRPTFRDVRSALAFAVTHDVSCAEVHAERHDGMTPYAVPERLYFNALFDRSGSPDLLLDAWAELDPALVPSTQLDRHLYFHRHADQAGRLRDLFETPLTRPRLPQRPALEDKHGWLWSTKRQYFFEGHAEPPERLQRPMDVLPYRHLHRFHRAVAGEDDADDVLVWLLDGLARADGVPEDAVGQGLALRLNAATDAEVVVIKRFPADDFVISRPQLQAGFVESLPDHLSIEHRDGAPRLIVTLDLFELLMRAHEGYLPGAEEQRAFYEDLATFKDELLSHPAEEVLLVEAGRQVHRVWMDGDRLRREELVS
jgi:serine/threonine protein kinase